MQSQQRSKRMWAVLIGLTCTVVIAEPQDNSDNINQLMAVREAITETVLALRLKAAEDSSGFFVPPQRTRMVVDRRVVQRRYREVEIEQPVYEYEYENYRTVASRTDGSSVTGTARLETVTRRRVKSRKQVGTEKIKRLVADKDGPIVREERVPVYGPGGPDLLFPGFYAQNAMGILMFLRAGIEPTDTAFAKIIQSMVDYLDAYELPDRTFDLAWITAAFVSLPQDDVMVRQLTAAMVNKLLLGQIREGRGRGMWGPICSSPELLARLINVEKQMIVEHVEKWQERLRRDGNKERYEPRIEAGKELVNRFHKKLTEACRHGLQFEKLRNEMTIKASEAALERTGYELTERARIPGFPVFFYGEITSDIHSTSLVLFALHEARRNGLLPDSPTVPVDLQDRPVIRVATTAQIIADAAESLARQQNRNGTWNEGNSWQTVTDFDRIGIPGLPVEAKVYANESNLTLLSTVMGHVALADASALLGDAGLQYQQRLRASERTVAEMALALIKGDTRGLEIGHGRIGSYAFMFAIARLLEHARGSGAEGRALWFELADYLLKTRNAESGLWQSGAAHVLPTSWQAIVEQQAQAAAAREKQRNPKADEEQRTRHYLNNWQRTWGVQHDASLPASCYAALLLLQNVRPPLVGAWSWDGNNVRTSTVAPVIQRLSRENQVRLSYAELPAALPAAQLSGIPLLLVSGTGRFIPADPACGAPLMHYLHSNGMVVAESPANAEGNEFLSSLKAAILRLIPQSETLSLPAGAQLPNIEGIRGANGRMIAAFLPVQVGSDSNALSTNQARDFIYNLLKNSIDPELLNKDYAINWAIIEEAERELAAKRQAELEADFR